MSLETLLGRELNLFEETPEHAARVVLKSPILSTAKFLDLMGVRHQHKSFQSTTINLTYDQATGLEQSIVNVCDQAEEAARSGKVLICLSDRHIDQGLLPIPAAMATGAVHHRLIAKGLRSESNLIV